MDAIHTQDKQQKQNIDIKYWFKIRKVSPGGPRRMMFKGDHREIGRECDSWVKIATGRVQQ